jgi:alpha-glucosidase (family GH31 glycosyl hydrolase)
MEVTTKEGIHYGFLLPWAQVNSWNYFRHPWLQGAELCAIFRDYAQLRSKLIPYLYTYAHQAHASGIPMMRPLVLEFPEDPKATTVLTQYFLGRELLVSAFSEQVYLPAGKWWNFWTGEVIAGPKTIRYSPPPNRGGGLFAPANSIIPLGPVKDYVGQPTSEGLTLEVFVERGGTAEFVLYEDDGVSFAFENGKFRLHRLTATFHDQQLRIDVPPKVRIESIRSHLEVEPKRVALNGKEIPFDWSSSLKEARAKL